MFQKELLSNPDSSFGHCHCATITLTPTGDLLAAWYAYREDESRGAVLVVARKRAGRPRFEKPQRILSDMKSSLGNPVLLNGEAGRIHLLFVALRGHYWDSAIVNQSYSDDLGLTWSTPESLRLDPGMMVRYPPIVRKNTYFLLPAYDEKTNQTLLLTAGPDASGWMPVQHFDDIASIQADIVRQDDKNLTMIIRPTGDDRCCIRRLSVDDGRSWMPAMRTTLPNPLSGVAAFGVDDCLCAVYNHTTEHQRYPLSLAYSQDRGTSWSEPVHIDETKHEVSYPSFLSDDKGVTHGVYTFGRNSIQYVTFDRSWWMR